MSNVSNSFGEGCGDTHVDCVQTRRDDRRVYRWLMALTVACFLIVSIVTRLLPRSLRPFAATGDECESVFCEARRMAQTAIPYAFEW